MWNGYSLREYVFFKGGMKVRHRDFFKTVELVPNGLLPERYDLSVADFDILYRESRKGNDGLWNVIKWCLCYGYVMGHRATVNGVYKEVSRTNKNSANGETSAESRKVNQ